MDKAISLWRAGELVAFPTETVYGLGADAANEEAVARIYAVKSRPSAKAITVHVTDVAMAKPYVQWNETAEKLARAFWPGPLTLVLARAKDAPLADIVAAGGETVAVRAPDHALAQALLRAFGAGIAASSANISGQASPTTAQQVRAELDGLIPLLIDGGPCSVGISSTVLDLTGPAPAILRQGSIAQADIDHVLRAAQQ
ncbi:MAG: L-threonylcarbamoyladenylate synthase [Alphaproteobacteria bacterium]